MMNGIRNFFTNTLPSWWRNHPYRLLAGGVGSVVVLSGAANVFSPKTSDPKPTVDQPTTSYTQTMETTTETTSKETTTYTTAVSQTTTVATETTTVPVETTGAEVYDFDGVFMSDYLMKYIEKVTFEDDLEPYVIDSDSLLSGEGYIVDENGNITNSQGYTYTPEGTYIDESSASYEGDFFLAPDGLLYTSKEEYEKTLNSTPESSSTTKEEYDENGLYIAPDGSRWNSKQDYEDSLVYIEGEDYVDPTEPGLNEDGTYVDKDGIRWASEQEYLDFINLKDNNDGTYTDSEGNVWSSLDDYLKSLEGDVVYPGSEETDEPVVDEEPPVVEEPVEEDDGLFHAPDGSVWSSEQDYLDYVESLKPTEPAVTETTPVEETEPATTTTTVVEEETPSTTEGEKDPEEDGYYEAPDGSKWTSEQDYLDYVESLKPTESTVTETTPVEETETTTTTTVVEEETPTTEEVGKGTEEDEYYEAPDGSKWTSEEDYKAYIDSYNEMYNTETTTEATTTVETTTTTTEATTEEVATTKPTTTTEATTEKPTETEPTVTEPVVTEPVETEPVEDDNKSDYFQAPDGSYWTSEEDYNEFVATLSESGAQKVR